jgi:hypothetical protein
MTHPSYSKSLKTLLPSFRRKPESSSFYPSCGFVCAGLALLLALFSCSLPISNALLESPKLKNFEQDGPLTVYNRTNLFDYMNGEAEAYLPFGFHLLCVSVYRSETTESRMVLEAYDMSTPEGATGILKKYSNEGGSSLSGIGDAAWADKGIVLFRQGHYFVRIFPDPSPENEVRPTMQEMLALAGAIGGLLR